MAIMGDFSSQVLEETKRISSPEQMLGKALAQPFADSNSGARKLLYSVQYEHALPLVYPELPVLSTGYENRYGDEASSIITTHHSYEVLARIEKFPNKPGHHYYLILRNIDTNSLELYEKKNYMHVSESYGYRFDNSYVNALKAGDVVPKNTIIRKSTSYDEYMNRIDGVNLLATYMANEITKEDGMLVSTEACRKLGTVLYKTIEATLPENLILLNLYGDTENYKAWPDIGEMIQEGIVFAARQEKTDTALYSQAISNLSKVMISDDKYTISNGMIVDIEINCNNPELLAEKKSNQQLIKYYNEKVAFMQTFVNTVDELTARYKCSSWSHQLDTLYNISKRELRGDKFLNEKVYTGTQLKLVIEEYNIAEVGDKITNRYGGKGVISRIVPTELMPRIKSTKEPLDIVINSSTCNNRENIGQWHEMSLTQVGKCIIDMLRTKIYDSAESLQMITKYVALVAPNMAVDMSNMFNHMTQWEQQNYLQQILDDQSIRLSLEPISESITLDTLVDLYREFPWAMSREVEIAQKDSLGQIRWISARRKLTVGYLYMFRLKQYAEEKHSVTSLSATNLKNENSRNKANKNYRALHQSTPIRFGYMESADFGHMGVEYVIANLMIHSVSPQARRLVEKFFTENPYTVDIKLDSKSTNRSAEQLNVYLKSIGYRLNFVKKLKKKVPSIKTVPFEIIPQRTPFIYLDDNVTEEQLEQMWESFKNAKEIPFYVLPFEIY